MKKRSVTLAEAYRIVQKYRVGLKIKPSLIKKLAKMEEGIRGSVSPMYDMTKKKIVFVDKDSSMACSHNISDCETCSAEQLAAV